MERSCRRGKVTTEATNEFGGMHYSHSNHIALLTGIQIKVIHAGWLRDPETWPAGAVVPESDDELSRITSSPCPLPRITSKQESCMPPARPEDKQCPKHFQDI